MRIAVCDDNPKELERIKGCFCRIQGYDLVCSYFDSTSTVMEILKTRTVRMIYTSLTLRCRE